MGQAPLTILKMVGILLSLLMCWGSASAQSDQPWFHRKIAPLVVIDPGHGGYDTGSRGAAGTLEKDVSLSLARLLAVELGSQYQVILTRSDDYWLDINNRAAEANHQRADLFVSLHTSASFRFQVSGMTVSYYQDGSGDNTNPSESVGISVGTEDPPHWEQLQVSHHLASKSLAVTLQGVLGQTMGEVRVLGLPLAMLSGADMPAVILEIGYLTNPAEEIKLRDTNYLTTIARAISHGIDQYFSKTQ